MNRHVWYCCDHVKVWIYFILCFFVWALSSTSSEAAKRRGDWQLLWEVRHSGVIYYEAISGVDGNVRHIKLHLSNKSWKERGGAGEEISTMMLDWNEGKVNRRHVRKVLDRKIRDEIKQVTSLGHHIEWIYRDINIFKDYLNKLESVLVSQKNGASGVSLEELEKDQESLFALRQSLEKHPVHKSWKHLKVRREIEQIMLLFPEIRKNSQYEKILSFYWNHMLKRLRHEKYLTRMINFGTPLVLALGIAGVVTFATSGAALLPLSVTAIAIGGAVGGTQVALAVHKWRNVEKLGKISKRFRRFDDRVRNVLAHLIEKEHKSAEEVSAMKYLTELHEFNKQRRTLFDELIRSRTENRIRFIGGVLELLAAFSSLEQSLITEGAMHHLAAALSSEHQGLWAVLSHNLFETASLAMNTVDVQNHALEDVAKHDRWNHIKQKIKSGIRGDGFDEYDPLERPKL